MRLLVLILYCNPKVMSSSLSVASTPKLKKFEKTLVKHPG